MPDFTVHPHGDRWAVLEAGAESPVKEFPTREAAELAARDLAADGRVEVVDDDPSDLGRTPREPRDEPEPGPTGVDAAERSRTTQPGL